MPVRYQQNHQEKQDMLWQEDLGSQEPNRATCTMTFLQEIGGEEKGHNSECITEQKHLILSCL